MKCKDCPMRYICNIAVGGKEKCVFKDEKKEPEKPKASDRWKK